MSRRPPPDPITHWPKPHFRQSSVSIAAGRLWTRAEASWKPDKVDPHWLLDGAMAYALDLLEDVRKTHRLALDSTVPDILPFVTAEALRHLNPDRIRYVAQLLTYAIEHDDEFRFWSIVRSMDEASS